MLVVGLGNPGREYVGTRHNVGRDIMASFVEGGSFSEWKRDSYSAAFVAEGDIGETPIVVALPETYMNRSGEAVRELVKKHELQPEDVVVVYDDIDLPVGTVKISQDRGDGGHNGVKSIADHLKTRDFVRLRIGICPTDGEGEKNKPPKTIVRDYVLGRFSPDEQERIASLKATVEAIIREIMEKGVASAMSRYN